MTNDSLTERRNRTHAIVEGALLGDIALVFLLIRAYLPLPPVRSLLLALASVPLVMLVQRRGIRVSVLSGIASYVLLSALVGPLFGFAALYAALAGILIGMGRSAGLGPGLNTLWTGAVYAVLVLVVPTVAGIILFRYPVGKLIKAAKNFINVLFNLAAWLMGRLGAPPSAIHELNSWRHPVADHWQVVWLGLNLLLGILTMYIAVIASEIVLRQIPEHTLERQKAGEAV